MSLGAEACELRSLDDTDIVALAQHLLEIEVVGTRDGLDELLGVAVVQLIEHPREHFAIERIDR